MGLIVPVLLAAWAVLSTGQTDECSPTPSATEGPFFQSQGVPDKADWICRPDFAPEGAPEGGAEFTMTGTIFDEDCATPLGGGDYNVTLMVWQADSEGNYDDNRDTSTHYCRGLITVGEDGTYSVRTILPGQYQNGPTLRPRHMHAMVTAAGYENLITQVYWEGDEFLGDCCNSDDPRLWMPVNDELTQGQFNFTLTRAPDFVASMAASEQVCSSSACYTVVNRSASWADALSACSESGMQLVEISSEDEGAFVAEELLGGTGWRDVGGSLWMGLNNGAEGAEGGDWVWQSGAELGYEGWGEGEPGDAGTCGALLVNENGTSWLAADCAASLDGFVCVAQAS
ncbi:unnamed protein product [Ostreobium quekettii]|uniref:C-type lectin domain-containing protein n=1 Tax=Ostreobium quekettii TaxID=121088 RepID=A0A8S1IKT5_9CHLO|nr:unnamed protein product [Ostreobium quekettii]|eukprot:evm.model.scf_70EXC.7 EVM.evm.TU.scf_70EXC.7   scf_70EXC:129387-132943(+)